MLHNPLLSEGSKDSHRYVLSDDRQREKAPINQDDSYYRREIIQPYKREETYKKEEFHQPPTYQSKYQDKLRTITQEMAPP
jgi:hypothetical protein